MKNKLSSEEKRHLEKAFVDALPEDLRAKVKSGGICECDGCSCPPGSGEICDGGSMVGHAGGYYGAATA
jgi:hypothetical protein